MFSWVFKVKIFPDVSFAANNEWGVPKLDLAYCPMALREPFLPWGSRNRQLEVYGSWHFYVEDYKFQALWNNPQGIIASNPVMVVEPNFSIPPHSPGVTALYQIYRKRWLSRFWQIQGIFTIVDLNVPERHADLNMLGVPMGWCAFATRGDRKNISKLWIDWGIAKKKSGLENPMFIVYCGGIKIEAICLDMGWFYFDSHRG